MYRIDSRQKPAQAATAMDTVLPLPHYTNNKWRTPQIIFGREQKVQEASYSDRLWEWDREGAQQASAACTQQGLTPRTGRWIQAWLTAYHKRPVTLRYVFGGVNHSSGYEYYIYGYNFER